MLQKIKIKSILTLSLIALISFSCRTEGCRDSKAINFDPQANKDGTCRYTKVIFYANTNIYGGVPIPVVKVEVSRRINGTETLLGEITTFNEPNPEPINCNTPPNAIEFNFQNGEESAEFITTYYLENGIVENGPSYNFTPNNLTECIVESLTQ